jgi:hypothetical protein
MATLSSITGNLKAGQHDLQVSFFLGWHKVGTCSIQTNSQYEFSASGNYSVLGHNGNFNVDLKLTDKNPSATSGPCTVTNAGQTTVGTYQSTGTSIVFSGDGHTVTVSADASGVTLEVAGYPKGRIAS